MTLLFQSQWKVSLREVEETFTLWTDKRNDDGAWPWGQLYWSRRRYLHRWSSPRKQLRYTSGICVIRPLQCLALDLLRNMANPPRYSCHTHRTHVSFDWLLYTRTVMKSIRRFVIAVTINNISELNNVATTNFNVKYCQFSLCDWMQQNRDVTRR